VVAARPLSILLISKRLKAKLENHLRAQLLVLKTGLAKESNLTRAMLVTYYQYTTGEVTLNELHRANRQFRSFLKTMGMGVLVILPFAPLSIPAIIMLGKRLGVDVIPDSFKEENPEIASSLLKKES
jgi:hypothetical protein